MRALEKRTGEEFAIKVFKKSQIQSIEHAEHIVREKKLLMQLSETEN